VRRDGERGEGGEESEGRLHGGRARHEWLPSHAVFCLLSVLTRALTLKFRARRSCDKHSLPADGLAACQSLPS
jgi:hypothetical protein